MEGASGKLLLVVLIFAVVIVRLRGEQGRNDTMVEDQSNGTVPPQGQSNGANVDKSNKTRNEVVVNSKGKNNGGGGGGGGGGFVWGWGGGGGGYWRWGCGRSQGKRGQHQHKDQNGDYKMGEYAQCMVRGRCSGMRLDCPLHCSGPCFYDCRNMCKAHCKR